ncbi:hypothetical protein EV714DRAFT_234055 [Schizophyllum commune]
MADLLRSAKYRRPVWMAQPATSTSVPPSTGMPIDDPLLEIWAQAVSQYERDTGKPIPSGPTTFRSTDAIIDYIHHQKMTFEEFLTKKRWRLIRGLRPVAQVVGTLSGAIGEGVGLIPAGKVVVAAMGELAKAAMAVHDDFAAICNAFETMERHLRIVQPTLSGNVDSILSDASLKLMAQILVVLGVVSKMRQSGRLVAWLKKIAQSKDVSSALSDLGQLATSHHHAVSAVTLVVAQKTLCMLRDSIAWTKKNRLFDKRCLARISQTAENAHGKSLHMGLCLQTRSSDFEAAIKQSSIAAEQIQSNHALLEKLQNLLLHYVSLADGERVWTLISMPDGTDLMREESSLKPVQNTGRFRNGKWQWVITHDAYVLDVEYGRKDRHRFWKRHITDMPEHRTISTSLTGDCNWRSRQASGGDCINNSTEWDTGH